MKKAAIVAIGTEITDGQILNSNAQWLSQKLVDLNFEIVLHISAPDERSLMKKTITTAQEMAELIFICGGLGPTSDDITRDVLSELLQCPLEFNETAWQDVTAKLSSRHVILREGHRRQCLIPKGARTHINSVGVAPGFSFEHNEKYYCVLPGPPVEIEALWNEHIHQQLQSQFSTNQDVHLKTWLCLGAPESELAHLTESFFAKKNYAQKLGYRLLAPYVELKLWHRSAPTTELNDFTAQLQDYYVADQMEDIHQKLQEKLRALAPTWIDDRCSSGLLLQRLTQALGPLTHTPLKYMLRPQPSSDLGLDANNRLTLEAQDDEWVATWETPEGRQKWTVTSPSRKRSKWREHYVVEKLILEWMKVL